MFWIYLFASKESRKNVPPFCVLFLFLALFATGVSPAPQRKWDLNQVSKEMTWLNEVIRAIQMDADVWYGRIHADYVVSTWFSVGNFSGMDLRGNNFEEIRRDLKFLNFFLDFKCESSCYKKTEFEEEIRILEELRDTEPYFAEEKELPRIGELAELVEKTDYVARASNLKNLMGTLNDVYESGNQQAIDNWMGNFSLRMDEFIESYADLKRFNELVESLNQTRMLSEVDRLVRIQTHPDLHWLDVRLWKFNRRVIDAKLVMQSLVELYQMPERLVTFHNISTMGNEFAPYPFLDLTLNQTRMNLAMTFGKDGDFKELPGLTELAIEMENVLKKWVPVREKMRLTPEFRKHEHKVFTMVRDNVNLIESLRQQTELPSIINCPSKFNVPTYADERLAGARRTIVVFDVMQRMNRLLYPKLATTNPEYLVNTMLPMLKPQIENFRGSYGALMSNWVNDNTLPPMARIIDQLMTDMKPLMNSFPTWRADLASPKEVAITSKVYGENFKAIEGWKCFNENQFLDKFMALLTRMETIPALDMNDTSMVEVFQKADLLGATTREYEWRRLPRPKKRFTDQYDTDEETREVLTHVGKAMENLKLFVELSKVHDEVKELLKTGKEKNVDAETLECLGKIHESALFSEQHILEKEFKEKDGLSNYNDIFDSVEFKCPINKTALLIAAGKNRKLVNALESLPDLQFATVNIKKYQDALSIAQLLFCYAYDCSCSEFDQPKCEDIEPPDETLSRDIIGSVFMIFFGFIFMFIQLAMFKDRHRFYAKMNRRKWFDKLERDNTLFGDESSSTLSVASNASVASMHFAREASLENVPTRVRSSSSAASQPSAVSPMTARTPLGEREKPPSNPPTPKNLSKKKTNTSKKK